LVRRLFASESWEQPGSESSTYPTRRRRTVVANVAIVHSEIALNTVESGADKKHKAAACWGDFS